MYLENQKGFQRVQQKELKRGNLMVSKMDDQKELMRVQYLASHLEMNLAQQKDRQ